MKPRAKPLSMTRNVMTSVQIFRRVEQKGVCCSRGGKWPHTTFGGPYRDTNKSAAAMEWSGE